METTILIGPDGKPVNPKATQLIESVFSQNAGKYVKVTAKEATSVKIKQYNYLYGICYPIISFGIRLTANVVLSIDDVDILMKKRFWYTESYTQNENKQWVMEKIPRSKRDMNRAQMSDFIQNCINFGIDELGVDIPQPPQKNKGNYENNVENTLDLIIHKL